MATATAAEVLIYGVIGDDVTDRQFATEMSRHSGADEVTVRLNSGGGSVVHGLAIYDSIIRARASGQRVTTVCDGCAFSMASILLQAGSPRLIAVSGLVMIHSPFMDNGGNARELRKAAESLDKVEARLVEIYVRRSGRTAERIMRWMNDETWFDAKETVEFGLADRIVSDAENYSALSDKIMAKAAIPANYVARLRAPIERDVQKVESLADDACRWSLYWSTFDYRRREAARIAKALNDRPGTTSDDRDRILAALDRIKKFRDWPPYELK